MATEERKQQFGGTAVAGKQKTEGPVVGAFAQNADIKSLIRKECLA